MIDGKFGEIPLTCIIHSHYLSVDPGETIGITFWDGEGKPTHYNEFNIEQINEFLDLVQEHTSSYFKRIIIEEFVLYQKLALAQSGSRLWASQVIGMIKRLNYSLELPDVVEVRADAKEVAAKWSGTKMPKRGTHMENWKASYLVGYYWLHTQGIIPARVLEQA